MPDSNGSKQWRDLHFRKQLQHAFIRIVRRQLIVERSHNEKLCNDILEAVDSEIEFLAGRMTERLAEIEASLSLIAHELSRWGDMPAPDPPTSRN